MAVRDAGASALFMNSIPNVLYVVYTKTILFDVD